MAILKNRDFTYRNTKFHLNDNKWKHDFEGKYRLMYYNEYYNQWRCIATADTMKEAKEIVKKFF